MDEIKATRRNFLRADFPQSLKGLLKEVISLVEFEEENDEQNKQLMETIRKGSFSTLRGYPFELLAASAASMGLDVEGKSRAQLTEEIYEKLNSG